MTRETKVGLVIGLGVILLVGIIVSEYFVRDDSLQEQPLAAGMSDFNNNSNQSALHTQTPDGGVIDPYAPVARTPVTPTGQVTDPGAQPNQPPTTSAPGPRTGPRGIGVNVALDPLATGQRPGIGPVNNTRPGTTPGNHVAQPPVTPNDTQRQRITPPPGGYADMTADRDETPTLDTTQPIDPLPTAAPAPTMIEHVVKEGETLTQIARHYYHGDGNMWRSIRDANRDFVDADGRVRAGSTLRIPMRSADNDADETTAPPTRADVGEALSDNARVTAQRGRRVIVKDGDTLSGIASEHLGSANDWQLIIDANPEVLTDPSQLRAGMRLRIPAQEEADIAELANGALSAPAEPPPVRPGPTRPQPNDDTRPSVPAGRTYTVVSGDSLYRIAEKMLGNGNRFRDIYEANKDQLDNENDIREGMVLRIPSAD